MCQIKSEYNNYKPIDCNLYDVYVLYAMHKTKVNIYDNAAKLLGENMIIIDLFTKDKVEYLKLENSNTHRLDMVSIEKSF